MKSSFRECLTSRYLPVCRALLLGGLVAGCGGDTDITQLTALASDRPRPGNEGEGSTAPGPDNGAGHAGSSPIALPPAPDHGMGAGDLPAMGPDLVENGAGGSAPQAFAQTFFGLPEAFERRVDAPKWLSELLALPGERADEESLAAALRREVPALFPYEVQTPLWTDGAHKRRWIALPEAETIGFSAEGSWVFPEGTVFVKHFEMALDESQPEQHRLLETRFLVAATDGAYYGVSYRWNAAGTDAELVRGPQTEELEVMNADGAVRRQRYYYPGPADCLTCHNATAGSVLGVHTAQLNGSRLDAASGSERNQLVALQELGWLDVELEPDTSVYPRLVPLDDASSSLYDRVRSYLDSNCSMCHGARTEIQARWDARFETPLEERGLIAEPPIVVAGNGRYLVEPSEPDRSVLYQRVAVTLPGFRMPPLGRNRPDERFLELLRAWIESLPAPGRASAQPTE